jgi:hypothetical protein
VYWARLAQLKSPLDALPSSVLTCTNNFGTFHVGPGEVNDYGYTGAVNHARELTFGRKSRSSGDRFIPLTGHWPGFSAIGRMVINSLQS